MSSRLAEGLTALGHAAVVAVLGVGSGTLECGGANVTAKEAQHGERLYAGACALSATSIRPLGPRDTRPIARRR